MKAKQTNERNSMFFNRKKEIKPKEITDSHDELKEVGGIYIKIGPFLLVDIKFGYLSCETE